jgi:branched-chain amino acid transport system ATP-binding protein
MALLEVNGVGKRFGGLIALDRVSLAVEAGSITGLIGPNGAGKTTLFNVVSGFYRPTSGVVHYKNMNITAWPTHKIAAAGLVRTFQLTNLFRDMDVWSNVLVGASTYAGVGLDSIFVGIRERQREQATRERAELVLSLLGLASVRTVQAGSLPYGIQRLVSVAIALATGPELLLLDEPMAGMNAVETSEMASHLRRIRDTGVTLLLVEHNMQALMPLVDHVVVLNFGKTLAEGVPEAIRQNPEVVDAYLGTAERTENVSTGH